MRTERTGSRRAIAIAVAISDGAGNRGTSTETEFVVDAQAPAAEIVFPADGGVVYRPLGSFEVGLEEIGSGADPATAVVVLDGSPIAADCAAVGGGSTCVLPSPIASGSHTLRISVADRAGHRSAEATSAFSVSSDTVPPALAFTSPAQGSSFDPQTVPFTLSWSDDVSGVAGDSLRFWIGGHPISADCSTTGVEARCVIPERLYGPVALDAQVGDRAGNASAMVRLTFTVPGPGPDAEAPRIVILAPGLEASVASSPVEIRGRLTERATLRVENELVDVHEDRTFRVTRPIVPGGNSFRFVATDLAGNSSELTVAVSLDETAPLGLDEELVEVQPSVAGTTPFLGSPGAVLATENEIAVEARSRRTGAVEIVPVHPDRSFTGSARVLPGDTLELRVVDRAGNSSAPISRAVTGVDPLPPAPNPGTRGTDRGSAFCVRYSYLWSGPSPAMFATARGAIDCSRVAIVRGQVLDDQGLPLAGVRVRTPDDPGVGLALTRDDGWFDLAANGGGAVGSSTRRLAGSRPGDDLRSPGVVSSWSTTSGSFARRRRPPPSTSRVA